MKYTIDGSSTTYTKTDNFFRAVGYSSNTYFSWGHSNNEITYNLDRGRPVIIGADKPDWSGHVWVMDGYKYMLVDNKTRLFVHCNWGWNGYNNGYFLQRGFFISYSDYNQYDGSYNNVNFNYDRMFNTVIAIP